ncbi:MAG: M56 family metallopeptidase [Planctomycetaceae bacterium]
MATFIEMADRFSPHWWNWVTTAALQSAVVAAIVLLVVTAGRRHMSAVLQAALVTLAFVKFLLPTVWPVTAGMFGLMSADASAPQDAATGPAAVAALHDASGNSQAIGFSAAEPPDPFRQSDQNSPAASTRLAYFEGRDVAAPDLRAMYATDRAGLQDAATAPSPVTWLLLHATGSFILLSLIVRVAFSLRHRIAEAAPVETGEAFRLFVAVRRELGIRRDIALRVSADVASPLAAGLLRPMVLIPRQLLNELPAGELRALFAHELAHHRRFDPWVNLFQAGVLCVWWFHPLAWALHVVSRRIREQCCDDVILQRGVTTVREYSGLLFRMVGHLSDKTYRQPLLSGAGHLYSLVSRMQHIVDGNTRRSAALSWRSLLVLTAAAVILLPGFSASLSVQTGQGQERKSTDQATIDQPEPAFSGPSSLPRGAILQLGSDLFRHNADTISRDVGRLFLADNKTVIGHSRPGHLLYWDVSTGEATQEPEFGDQEIAFFRLSPSRTQIAAHSVEEDFDTATRVNVVNVFGVEGGLKSSFRWKETFGAPTEIVWMPDDRNLITATSTGTLRIWDVDSGSEVLVHEEGHNETSSVGVSADGRTVGWVAQNRTVHLWDWQTQQVPTVLPSEERIEFLQFSPTSDLFATTGERETPTQIWNLKTRTVERTLSEAGSELLHAANLKFAPDGRSIATFSFGSQAVTLWDVQSGKRIQTLDCARMKLQFVDISPDSRWLVVGDYGAIFTVFDLETSRRINSDTESSGWTHDVQFSPDGTEILTADGDGIVRIWHARSGQVRTMLRHNDSVRAIAASTDGRLICSNSTDDTIRLWNAETGQQLVSLPGHTRYGGNRAAMFTPDGSQLLTWGDDMFLRVSDVRDGRAVHEHTLKPEGVPPANNGAGGMMAMMMSRMHLKGGQFSRDGRYFVLGLHDGLCLFSVSTGAELKRIAVPNLATAAVNQNAQRIAAVAALPEEPRQVLFNDSLYRQAPRENNDVLKMLAPASDEPIWERQLVPLSVRDLKFSGDDRMVAVSGYRRGDDATGFEVHIFDAATGDLLYHLPEIPLLVRKIAFSPDGQRLVTALADSTLLVWDLNQFRVDPDAAPPVR